MASGGKRAGAGRPKGSKGSPVRQLDKLDREAARELVREKVSASLGLMLRSHIAHAIGICRLYTRDKAGKYTRIESEVEIDRLLAEGVEGRDYWIFTKDPSVSSFTDLLNRSLGKPVEQVEMAVSGNLTIEHRLLAARKRLAEPRDT